MYDYTVAGATIALPDIQIGGPVGGGDELVKDFLQHCHDNGTRVSFISWHCYCNKSTDATIKYISDIPKSIGRVKTALKLFPAYSNLKLLITEYNLGGWETIEEGDLAYLAAFHVRTIRTFLDSNITLALPYPLIDCYNSCQGFCQKIDILTKALIPTKSFRMFERINKMNGNRIEFLTSSSQVDGFASINNAGDSCWIALCNILENTKKKYVTKVSISVNSLPQGTWTCKRWKIEDGVSDAALTHSKLLPTEKTEPLANWVVDSLVRTSFLQSENVSVQNNRVIIKMPHGSASFLELTRN